MHVGSKLLVIATGIVSVVTLGFANSSQAGYAQHYYGGAGPGSNNGPCNWKGKRLPSGNRVVICGCMRCILPPAGYLGRGNCVNACMQ